MNSEEILRLLARNAAAVERAILLIDNKAAWMDARDESFGTSLATWIRERGGRLTVPQLSAARNMLHRYVNFLAIEAKKKAGRDLPSPIPGERLRYELLPGGIKRVVHVLAPALKGRIEAKDKRPVMAVRDERDYFTQPKLYRWVEILGPSALEEWFSTPLPGTEGRGVVPLVTTATLRVWVPDLA